MRFTPVVEAEGFLFLHPDGTEDCNGGTFWNATPACCDFCGSGVDDSAYLKAVVDEVKASYKVAGPAI